MFIKAAWPILEPATPYTSGWHLDAIVAHLEAVSRRQIRNLLINMPPRHMKSLAVSVFWPVWEWINHPESRWLFSSYALSLSIRDSLKCRRLIESPWFQARWSDKFQLTSDQNAKMRYENDRMGYRIATSVGGAATGEGGDYIIVDDPHNVQEKESDVIREATLVWWDETMSTRLNDPKTGCKVIVMQRVHECDLSGHVLQQGGYEHLCLPAEYEPGRHCATSLGWQDPRKSEGELLWPERVGPKEIADLKVRLGPTGYAGQFQQSPTPAGGGRFKSAYFRYWTEEGNVYQLHKGETVKAYPKHDCWRFMMMDPAGTEKKQNNKPCYTVIQVWDITPNYEMLLIHQYREQVETPDAEAAAMDIYRRFQPMFLGVEKDGLGLGVVQTIQRKGVAVLAIKAQGSKEARSETAEIRMAAGMIYFPHGAPFLFELEKELLHFPNGEYMDQADTLSHAARLIQDRAGPPRDEATEEFQKQQLAAPPIPSGRYRRNF